MPGFFAIPSGPIGYYLKKKYHIPYIIRFCGGDIPGFQDRFKVVYKLLGPFEKQIWKQASALVANSQGLKELAEKFYDKKEIKIITNGVDVEWLQTSKEEKKASDHIDILFVSRLIKRKGLQHILPQLQAVQDAVDLLIALTIVGDGPYREHLEMLVKEHKLENTVHFVGQKNKTELPMYYQNADVFILPSKKEGMSNAVLEAMASGLPIVMTPCEGSAELVQGNGYVIGVNEFGDKLITLCKDDKLRNQMGEESLKLVHEKFQWESIADEYLKLLDSLG